MQKTSSSGHQGPEKASPIRMTRAAELRRIAARRRKAAEDLFALAHACTAVADRIMFEEFGRRELEAYRRLEHCADLYARASRLHVIEGERP